MRIVKKVAPYFLLISLAIFFFHKTFIHRLIPFPGDLLVSEYQPFRSYSYLGYPAGGVPNKAQYFDSIREFYPWRSLVNDQLKKGKLPLWNPYNFSGSPLLANYQSGVFYPLNLFYLVFNQINAWTILVILQPLLASLFTYLYGRKIGFSFWAALLTSITFSYSSYMNVWLDFNTVGHTILWLPLILYSSEKILEKGLSTRGVLPGTPPRCPRCLWALVFTLSLSLSLFAGHPIDFAIVYLFSVTYLTFRIITLKKEVKKSFFLIINYFLLITLPLIIGSIQLLPTIGLFFHSTRVAFSYDFFIKRILLQPYQLIVLFIPDFFGHPATRNFWLNTSYVGLTLSIGLTPLLFVSLLILSVDKIRNCEKFQHIKFFLLTAFLVLFFTTNTPLTRIFYKLPISFIATNSPTKLFSLWAFSLSILAGFGLDFYLKEKKKLSNLNCFSKVKSLFPFIFILFLAWISLKFIPQENLRTSFRNTLLVTAIFLMSGSLFLLGVFFPKFYLKKLVAIFLILISIFESYYGFSKFNPFSPREFIFPEAKVLNFLKEVAGINRFWGYGTAKIDSNIATYYRLFSPDGFDALNLRWYNQFISASKTGKIKTNFSHLDRSIAEISAGYGEEDLPNNHFRLRVLDSLGVKYILDRVENPKNEKTFPKERFRLVWEDEAGWRVFENLKAASRFFLTTDVKTYNSREEFEKIFFSENFNPGKTILLKGEDFNNLGIEPLRHRSMKNTSVVLRTYEPNRVIFKAETPVSAFLFLSDTFDDGWRAYIDGRQIKILRANWAFRSILVPKGKHEILFLYKPSIFKLFPDFLL